MMKTGSVIIEWIRSLGIDSLIAVEIKQRIERLMGFSLSFKEVRDLTVSNLQQLVNNRDLS